MIDYGILRLIWWALLGVLLIGFAVLDGFDLGVAMLHPFVARNDAERRVSMNTIGPVWEGNQIWFVLGGGAVFAAWPVLYSVSFSGFYLAMMLVLIGFILRPVALTYRSKRPSPVWRATWDYAFFVAGLIPSLVFGVAFGNLLLGAPFYFQSGLNVLYQGNLLGLLNPFALLCGLVSIAMLVMQGGSYLAVKTEGEVAARARRYGAVAAIALALLFAVAGLLVWKFVEGYVWQGAPDWEGPSNPTLKTVTRQAGAWLANYGRAPITIALPILGLVGAVGAAVTLFAGWARTALTLSSAAIAGVILTAGVSLFPFLMPSSSYPDHSLTVWDSSSSRSTLFLMLLVVVVFLPIVLAYTFWAYRVFRGLVSVAAIERGDDYNY
ncbi:cytochrome d ubiquinol oxidase subunit II [Methylocystis bryophila]|uniref:Cytochrome d ubiquinol oxidase subunit II n=1 Tax=Methylocystis bryophila TaxID=655015 RepID=A0A1W6MUX9_9HYPH|nr:cytochrome d ubiquinol oxidase subunit II [Methylocystis bryophila]ARN81410.1 cytochrome d ubiquinol oxidase subunit II [Methylocystis bryophila]BDV37407.1 cytochrome D ubiquinol oxidase subunit II [Methylocystis bryophila]